MRQRGLAAPVPPSPMDSQRAATVRAIAERHAGSRGPLLPILHAVVEELGHVADEDVATVADVLNLSRADVHGVVTFYHDFRRTPPAAHRVELCRAEACQAVGAQAVFDAVTQRYAGDEDVEVGQVFCFGNCALGPSGTVDGRLRGRLTADLVTTELEVSR